MNAHKISQTSTNLTTTCFRHFKTLHNKVQNHSVVNDCIASDLAWLAALPYRRQRQRSCYVKRLKACVLVAGGGHFEHMIRTLTERILTEQCCCTNRNRTNLYVSTLYHLHATIRINLPKWRGYGFSKSAEYSWRTNSHFVTSLCRVTVMSRKHVHGSRILNICALTIGLLCHCDPGLLVLGANP